ncbi:hypothetical protein M758_3G091100 [Ceratodon purpureus]|uniref:Uncharacterized protein n=1 Tax=Ceratodon purpureus TaxID=3225 RepID=A0A8T0IIJ7_CERPU|nr:hypothetical protein KC19_3G089000 [Ceratodon purpureus]KAG0622347.1 hypothetical protein M758_3G091100 [Ceratodon purpureus]
MKLSVAISISPLAIAISKDSPALLTLRAHTRIPPHPRQALLLPAHRTACAGPETVACGCWNTHLKSLSDAGIILHSVFADVRVSDRASSFFPILVNSVPFRPRRRKPLL